MHGHSSTVRERTACYASFALSVACVFSTSCGGGGASGGATIQPVPQISLRSTSIFVGPAAGATGAALVTSENGVSVSWTASTSTAWIHLTDTNGGTASLVSVARFTYDANTGATRQGLIAFQSSAYSGTLTVTQAGVGYAATLPAPTTLLTFPNVSSFAVDLSGNLYYFVNGGATTPGTLQEWMASTGTSKTLNFPSPAQCSVIVDAAQAIYVNEAATLIADVPQFTKCPGLSADEPEELTLQWLLAAPNSTLIDYETPQMSAYWAGFTPDFKGNNFAAVSTEGNTGPTTSTTSIYSEGANGLSSQAIATLPYFASGFTGDTSGNFFMIGASASSPYDYTIVKVNSQSSSSSVLTNLPPNTVPMGLALDGSGNLYSLLLDLTAPTYPTYYLTQWSQSNNQLTRMSPTQPFDGIYGEGVGKHLCRNPVRRHSGVHASFRKHNCRC
jgi:hypothetical protein